MRSKPIRVLVFGTFDLLHPGHVSFLRQAKRHGTELIVALGRDRVVTKLKGHRTHDSERQRQKKVNALPYVNRALLAPKNPSQRYVFIKRLKPDVLALGYDQSHYTQDLARELKKRRIKCRIIRLRPYRPTVYKSSLLRPSIAQLKVGKKDRL